MRRYLRDIAEIGAGQGAPQGDYNYCDDGLPFVKAGNLQELTSGGSINDIQKVSDEVAKAHKLKLYPKGTVLFAKSGMSCLKGYVYVLPVNAYVVSHLACITPKENISEYLRLYFTFHKPNQLVKDAAYPSISLTDIGNLEVDTKDEQTRDHIITVLKSVEEIIELRTQELQRLDDLIKARFVELFGDPISNSQNLRLVSLKDVCSKITDGTHDTPPRYQEGYLLITGKNVRSTGLVYDEIEYVCKKDHETIYARCNPEYGDVLYTNIGVNYGTACFNDLDYEFSMKNVALLKPIKNVITGRYLWQCLNIMRDYILSMNQVGGAQTFMGLAIIKGIVIPLPTLESQKQFSRFVEQVDKSKAFAQKALDEAQILFDSLMQQYFG